MSAFWAQRSDWAGYEVVRVFKVPLILLYCRYNIGKKEWWVCIASLGLSVSIQAIFGILQVAGILGNYQVEDWDSGLRAAGTLAHASLLSSYLLLLLPLFAALTITVRRIEMKVLSGLAALIALAGVGCTMSRIPWIISVLEAAALTLGLLRFRLVPLKRTIAVWSISIALLGISLIPFYNRIQQRATEDVDTAIQWRLRMNEIGFDLFQEHAFLGIGLANFPLYLRNMNMEFGDSLDMAMSGIFSRNRVEREGVEGFHWVWVPHNLYVLLLAETGFLGLCSFLVFIGASVRIALRSLRSTEGAWRVATLGLLVGMCGILGHMMTDWAMWLDPILFTFALVVSLLNNAPTVIPIRRPEVSFAAPPLQSMAE